jgi:YggT family protein
MESLMLLALISIIGYLISIIVTVVIVQFILSLLIAFNVVNLSNQYVSSIWHALNMILDPFLKPIRRIMPDTGMIDFSPIVLIVGLNIVQMLLTGVYRDMYMGGL